MSSTADHLIEKYMAHLRIELADLPRARQRELEQEIGEHIAAARAELPNESEAEIRNMLERIGDPEEIAAEAHDRVDPPAAVPVEQPRSRTHEVVALVFLLVGGLILPIFGWFVGLVLLWTSTVWTTGEKILGTIFVPGGLVLPLGLLLVAGTGNGVSCGGPIVGGALTCTDTQSTSAQVVGTIAVILLVIAPLATVAYLATRLRRPSVSLA
ncbi:MAG TPA: hypothetical protein VE693_00405 [Gaiellaceae bacterium]|jgi:hypothetical protein|nr:hypothetical protein [Gaiellaceae bacterium]